MAPGIAAMAWITPPVGPSSSGRTSGRTPAARRSIGCGLFDRQKQVQHQDDSQQADIFFHIGNFPHPRFDGSFIEIDAG
jgi:hypothetical protein